MGSETRDLERDRVRARERKWTVVGEGGGRELRGGDNGVQVRWMARKEESMSIRIRATESHPV